MRNAADKKGKVRRKYIGGSEDYRLKVLKTLFGFTAIENFRGPVSKTMLAVWIANLRKEKGHWRIDFIFEV